MSDAGSNVEPCPWCMGDGADEYHLRALDAVVADLSDLGFDAEWTGLRAADVGAPHGRFRFFLLAYARGVRLDERWNAASRQAAGGRASTVTGGCADAPVERPLLRTPVADELGGGPLHPDVAKERGQTLRLSGQVLALGGHLLPTPSATSPNEDEPIEAWVSRRERVKESTGNGNGFGMPLGVAVRLLPTTTAGDAKSSRNSSATRHKLPPTGVHAGDTLTDALVPVDGTAPIAWGVYEPAVRLWESLTRPAPVPTLPDGKNGNHRLAAVFPEWMMGYPAGWVTDILKRNPAIKACGNGVVPQQAFAALSILWARVMQWLAVS